LRIVRLHSLDSITRFRYFIALIWVVIFESCSSVWCLKIKHALDRIHERFRLRDTSDASLLRKQTAGVGRRSKASAAKAEAAQARREHSARGVGQSLRDVYRKLVSALHPDREPDAGRRAASNA